MDLLTELQKIRGKLGEGLDYKEYLDVQKYLEENPNLPLNDLYNNKENLDRFDEWRFNKKIKGKKIFAVIYKDNQMQIDYIKVEPFKFSYSDGMCLYNRNQLYLTLEDAKNSLRTYRPGFTYTENTQEYLKSKQKDIEEMIKVYYGKSKLDKVWFQKVDELNKSRNIEKIYEVYTKGFLGAWYLVKDKDENRYIVIHKTNDVNTKFMMNQFLNENDCEKVETNELNIMKYNIKGEKAYNQMIFNYLIDFKNAVESKYFKLNLNRIDNIVKFIEDNNNAIENNTKEYLKDNILIRDNNDLKECFIQHVKFDIKCKIESELNSLNFSKNNWYINENNVDEFVEEFTRKVIYGEHIEQIQKANDFLITEFEEEIEINKNKLELYFCNAYDIFPIFQDKVENFFYDGYLTLNTENRTSKIEVVEINDNNDRQYYEYMPNKEETEKLFKVAEEYCNQYNHKTLEDFQKEELVEEEEENEQ